MKATIGSVTFGPARPAVMPVTWPANAGEIELLEAKVHCLEVVRDAQNQILRDARRMMGLKTGDDFLLAIAALVAAVNHNDKAR
jgi:hypothetical protein